LSYSLKHEKSGKYYYSFLVYDNELKKNVRLKKSDIINRFGKNIESIDEAEEFNRQLKSEYDCSKLRFQKLLEWQKKYFNFSKLLEEYTSKQKRKSPYGWKNSVHYLKYYVLPYFLNIAKNNNINAWHVDYAKFRIWLEDDAKLVRNSNINISYSSKNHAIKALNTFMKNLKSENVLAVLHICEAFDESKLTEKSIDDVITEDESWIIYKKLVELGKTRDYLVDPSVEQIFGSSKEVFASGGAQLVQLTKKAKLAGVNLVLFGRITKARVRQHTDEVGVMRDQKSFAETEVELRMFDIHSGKEIFVAKQNGNVDDKAFRFYLDDKGENLEYRKKLMRYSVQVAMKKFMPKIVELGNKLEWIGRIAKIIGTKIYVNAGRQSGIQVGDVLKVTTDGQEIYDPETGALIGYSEGDVKGTIEIIDYFGPDGAVAILHSGGSVTEGDFIELY
jgi:hypothetical protein